MGQATAAAVVVVGSTVYSSSRSSSSSYRRECLGLKFGNSETRLATDPRKQCKAIRASLPVGRRPWRSASKKKAIKHGQEHGKTYGCIQYTPQKRQGYIMVYSDIYIYIYVYIYIYIYRWDNMGHIPRSDTIYTCRQARRRTNGQVDMLAVEPFCPCKADHGMGG